MDLNGQKIYPNGTKIVRWFHYFCPLVQFWFLFQEALFFRSPSFHSGPCFQKLESASDGHAHWALCLFIAEMRQEPDDEDHTGGQQAEEESREEDSPSEGEAANDEDEGLHSSDGEAANDED